MITSAAIESPARIFEAINSYHTSAALKSAIDIDLFTAIAEGSKDTQSIAARCGVSEKGARVLADFLVVSGFVTKNGEGYGLSGDTGAFLNKHSPAYIGTAADFLLNSDLISHLQDLTEAVQRGGSRPGDSTIDGENPMWVEFAHAMKSLMGFVARAVAEVVGPLPDGARVLDIAAGHGMFGIRVAERNPGSHLTALDWPSVVACAEVNAREAGLSDRFSTIPGDAFKVDLGGPYDLVLVPNFLHHFGARANEQFLDKVRGHLTSNGRVAIVEFVPNADRVSPPIPAAFSLVMLAGTPHGDAHTYGEYQAMLTNAGYSRAELRALEGMPQSVIIAYA